VLLNYWLFVVNGIWLVKGLKEPI